MYSASHCPEKLRKGNLRKREPKATQPAFCFVLCLQGDLDKAIAAYEQALAAAPNLAVVQLNMAAALTEWGTQLKADGANRSVAGGGLQGGGWAGGCSCALTEWGTQLKAKSVNKCGCDWGPGGGRIALIG